MNPDTSFPDQSSPAPQAFRAALAELVTIGMTVARMVERAAEAETALAEAAQRGLAAAQADAPLAASLAEAIEADQATAEAAAAIKAVGTRTEAVSGAFAVVARALRRTVLLAERLDRGWARPGGTDDSLALVRRQIARGVGDAMVRDLGGQDADGAGRLAKAVAERLDRPDTLEDIGTRPVQEIVATICRNLWQDFGLGEPPPVVAAKPGGARPVLRCHATGQDGPADLGLLRPPPQAGEGAEKQVVGKPAPSPALRGRGSGC